MTIDKNRLKALAEAATQGPWHHTGTRVSTERGNSVADCSRGDEEFIAAANPANILALLGEIDYQALELEGVERAKAELSSKLGCADEPRWKWLLSGADELIAERDQLKAENESLKGSCKAMGKDMAKVTRERNSARSKAEKLQAENEALRSQVATLQAEPNSYQSGYDAGRAAEKAHADNWRAEADGLRRDASRYRFLRNQNWTVAYLAVVINPKAAVKPGHVCPSGDRLDEQVDEAMKREASHD